MDSNERYVPRVSHGGYLDGYSDYRTGVQYPGYPTPQYPGYMNAGAGRPPVLVDTTSNYDTRLRSLFYPPRSQTYASGTLTLEKSKAVNNYTSLQESKKSKEKTSKNCLLAFSVILILATVVAISLAIYYGTKSDDGTPTPAPTVIPVPSLDSDPDSLVRGTLTLDNVLYDDALQDPTSPLYQFYRDLLCTEIVQNLESDVSAQECDIIQMSEGSLVVSWVIGVKPTVPILPKVLEAKIKTALDRWLSVSGRFRGRVKSVYKDACTLLRGSDKPCEQICINDVSTGQPICQCEEGYQLNTDGRTCSDINECATVQCPGSCVNTEGSYQCTCSTGYTPSDDGKDCVDINECAIDNGGCQQICNNTMGGYQCLCLPGFTSEGNTCVEVDQCESSPCEENCTTTAGSYYCSCGFNKAIISDGIHCTDVRIYTEEETPSEEEYNARCMINASVEIHDSVMLQWYFPNMTLVTNEVTGRGYAINYRVGGQRVSALTLTGLTASDSGNYSCVLKYHDQIVTSTTVNAAVSGITCVEGLVYCNNTDRCISEDLICNNRDDCGDGEDESNCFCSGFKCDNNVCLPIEKWCDGVRDCRSGSDEVKNCTLYCPEGFIKCNYSLGQCVPEDAFCNPGLLCDGGENNRFCSSCNKSLYVQCNNTDRCIFQTSMCDEVNDCGDWEDELSCPCFPKSKCVRTGICVSNDEICNGINDCMDGEDERGFCYVNCSDSFATVCNATHDCIYNNKLCDGKNDCGDWEDEKNCGPCPETSRINPRIHTHFRCDSGECLHYGLLCDGYSDCLDGSDENYCELACPLQFMRCNNTDDGRCIPEDYRCDGYIHCLDGEDEVDCGYINPCSDNEVYCNSTHKCILQWYICDGDNDCGDYEDETNCPCGSSEFSCADNSTCLYYSDWCNNFKDCSDGSDELPNCRLFCPENLFLCKNVSTDVCLPSFKVCNGVWDCGDGADERNCTCRYSSQVQCNNTFKCIWDTQLCDGTDNCGDYEDEIGCGQCSNTQFKCTEIDLCLDESKWCDGVKDCPQGSDEPPSCEICRKTCAPNQVECDGRCISGSKICDSVVDCQDYADERSCNCTTKQFKCDMGMCIDKSKLCDRHIDCPDESDESKCTKPCSADMFPCTTHDRCISAAARCDGKVNCLDFSDEMGCGITCNKPRDWTLLEPDTITDVLEVQTRLARIQDIGPFNVSCDMGMCIAAEFWCNGVIDCPDGSDETSCQPGTETVPVVTEWIVCPDGWFKCNDNRKCVPPEYRCDLLPDCDDESDEDLSCPCPPPESFLRLILPAHLFVTTTPAPTNTPSYADQADPFDWRRCNASGLCFWSLFLCDGWQNCNDGTDEVNAYCNNYDPCSVSPTLYTHCDSGECIARSEVCNSEPRCTDKSDEAHCTATTCRGFLCDGGRCIPSIAVCNGRRDCADWTDEISCSCNATTQYVCPHSTVCADKSNWCDGIPNCPNNADETNCTGAAAMCNSEQFYCDGRCIQKEHVCDGTVNCEDFSDERNCECSVLTFNCTVGLCLTRDKWCDGIVDCPDGFDEPDNCLRTCPPGFYWCEVESLCVHPFEVCQEANLSLCQPNTTQPEIDCNSVTISESLCGLPAINPQDIVPFIFSGDEAMPHSWPWVVGLRSAVHQDLIICGGSIIHPQWIVTAAHCVETTPSVDNYKVVVGNHRLDVVEPLEKELTVAQIIMHENWDTYRLVNDIALLKLSTPLEYNRHVRPVCVPQIDFAPGKLCTVVGWGDTLGMGEENVLNQARLPIITQQICQYWHRETSNVTSSMVCAGYVDGRRGNCYGDSGGPLLCARGGRFWIEGLVTWGKNGCKAEEAPMVFTRITSFYNWITQYVPLEGP